LCDAQIKDSLIDLDPRRQETVMEKVKKAVGLQEPGMMDKLRSKFGTGTQETLETAAHVVWPHRACPVSIKSARRVMMRVLL
jgi:hypothetical protein